MKRTAALMVIALVAGVTLAAAGGSDGDAVVGLWKTEPDPHGFAIVKITRDGDRYNGKIIWLEKPLYGPDEERPGQPKVDLNNPDPSLHERPILGLELLHGFLYAGKNKWKKGKIYDPNNGKTYKCKMWFENPSTLKVRGFIGFSLLGRNAVWVRPTPEEAAAAVPPPPPAETATEPAEPASSKSSG